MYGRGSLLALGKERMNLADKARDYANSLVAAKKRHLLPGWFARRIFGAKPRALQFEEYRPTDWPADHPAGKPIHSELILPAGLLREECAGEPAIFAFVFRPESCELVIMDISGPRMGICFSMLFDEKRKDFVINRRLWIS
jgi:hypothetical protein